VYLLVRGSWYAVYGDKSYFFYTLFSDFIHPSYFALYLNLAIVIVAVFYHRWFYTNRAIIYSSWFFLCAFTVCIFFCASKAGIISLLVTAPILIYYRLRHAINYKLMLIVLLAGGVLIFLFFRLFQGPAERWKYVFELKPEQINRSATESTAVRMLIWKEALKIISEHVVTGTGVADANDELYLRYAEEGLDGAFSNRLNAHNQFLQTTIGMGLIGFLLLFAMTFIQLFYAYRQNHFLYLVFCVMILIHFSVESMLQTAAGVIFFAFFYCYFNIVREEGLHAV
jgi:O-antigen ligase